MRAILSNDDEDWHSHLEQSVKELGLDWQAGFFMIGSVRMGGRRGACRAPRATPRGPTGGRLRPIREYRARSFGDAVAAESTRMPRSRFLLFLIQFVRECAVLFHSSLQYRPPAAGNPARDVRAGCTAQPAAP
ncbi:hypothetical protein LGN10_02545 [Burkholderia sp. AU32262]|nr:hypothetical protein [Burkholderia sp. AU32262]